MPEVVSVCIVGGGVIGCAIAWELSRQGREGIVLLERNGSIRGENQSSRNSGVIHAGIYYPKEVEPLKARLCVEGNRLLYEFCQEHGVPHRKTGKLVVATDPVEETYLDYLERVSRENGVTGVVRVDRAGVGNREPNVEAWSALFCPTTGIVDATELVLTLARLAASNGVILATGHEVVDCRPRTNGFRVTAKVRNRTESIDARILINAAGLYSDVIARMVNPESPYRYAPIRGESAKFYRTKRPDLSMNGMSVYPVPCGHFPDGSRLDVPFDEFQELHRAGEVSMTTGIHLTPTLDKLGEEVVIGDTVTIGPAYSVGMVDREDYRQTRDERYHLDMVRPFFPNLRLEDLTLHQAGINAKLPGRPDFVIERDPEHPACINLLGITSPGLTSSLAIARHVREMLSSPA